MDLVRLKLVLAYFHIKTVLIMLPKSGQMKKELEENELV